MRGKGIEPIVREYLKQPPVAAEIERLIDLVGSDGKDLIRDGEAQFKKLGRRKADLSRAEIAKAVGRPPEAVLPLLK